MSRFFRLIRRHWTKLALLFCLIYMMCGAANWGAFGFYIAVPFALLFVSLLVMQSRFQTMLWLLAAGLTLPPLAMDHASNRLLFPHLGSEFHLACGWAVREPVEGLSSLPDDGVQQLARVHSTTEGVLEGKRLPCGHSVTLSQMRFTRNIYPEGESRYHPVFHDRLGRQLTLDYQKLDEALAFDWIEGGVVRSSYQLQSDWSRKLGRLKAWLIWPFLLSPVWFFPVVIAVALYYRARGDAGHRKG